MLMMASMFILRSSLSLLVYSEISANHHDVCNGLHGTYLHGKLCENDKGCS
jgi:hypothetical protein